MADIDLKTETPDTTLPTTGFLFGADSQAASVPSVYSAQTVATTLLGPTTPFNASITADAPVLNLAQTWNASGVTFTGLRFNAATGSSAGSAAGSLLMDLQLEGISKFKVSKGGTVTTDSLQANVDLYWTRDLYALATNSKILFTGDTILTRRAAANLRLGAADAAAPVAQTLSVQSVVAGTTNTAGANLTITGSQGTGTGAGGSIIFQVAPAGAVSNSVQNALATALTINPSGTVSIGGLTIDPSNGGITFAQTFGIIMQTSNAFVIRHGNNDGLDVRPVSSGAPNILLKNASNAIQAALWGEATNTLALRNGANAQTFRVYNTTDGTNSEFLESIWSGNVAYIQTNKAGTGNLRKLYLAAIGIRLDPTPASGGTIEILAANIATDTTTGMKIGTATTQKLGFYNKTPVVQPTAVADATDAATAITQLNALLSRMRDLGLIAT